MNKSTPIKIFARTGAAALLVVLLGAMLSACSPDGADSARDDDGQSSPAAGSASAGERPGAASRDQRVQAAHLRLRLVERRLQRVHIAQITGRRGDPARGPAGGKRHTNALV